MILAQFSSSPTAFLSSLGSELPFGAAAAPTVEKSRAPEKPQKRGASRATLVVWIGMGGRAATVAERLLSLAPENAQILTGVTEESLRDAAEVGVTKAKVDRPKRELIFKSCEGVRER